MFIGREAELKFLNDKYEEAGGQLIVLYGRRRVGKTETLREFCRDKDHVFFSCTQATDGMQLERFSGNILREGIPASKYIDSFDGWEQALEAILELPYGKKKKLLIIDEFPYMCQGNKSIPSILQSLWDSKLKNSNVMIVLCGSAMSFMEKELLAEKNPLYGRATGIYKMTAMGFYDAIKFFPNYSAIDKVLAYSVLGGIPHYLRQWNPQMSVEENIKKYILTKGSVLYSETEFMLHQELRETAVYNSIIEAVALGNNKLNDISQKSLVNDKAKTNVYLKNLIELGIVEKEFSVDAKLKEHANSNRGLYKITDNFFRFWYAFGYANISDLEYGDVDGVYEHAIKPELMKFTSFIFEAICKDFIKELQKRNSLPFRYSKLGRWFGKTTVRNHESLGTVETEIDILAINKSGNEYILCECKFKNSPFKYSEYLDVIAKLTPVKKNAKFHYMLFSNGGFDDKIIEASKEHNLKLITTEEIVNYGQR